MDSPRAPQTAKNKLMIYIYLVRIHARQFYTISYEIGVRLFGFLVKLYVSGKVDDRIRVAAFAVIANGCEQE